MLSSTIEYTDYLMDLEGLLLNELEPKIYTKNEYRIHQLITEMQICCCYDFRVNLLYNDLQIFCINLLYLQKSTLFFQIYSYSHASCFKVYFLECNFSRFDFTSSYGHVPENSWNITGVGL